jgi:hypothetical protein
MRLGQKSMNIVNQGGQAHFIHGAGAMVNGKGEMINDR